MAEKKTFDDVHWEQGDQKVPFEAVDEEAAPNGRLR